MSKWWWPLCPTLSDSAPFQFNLVEVKSWILRYPAWWRANIDGTQAGAWTDSDNLSLFRYLEFFFSFAKQTFMWWNNLEHSVASSALNWALCSLRCRWGNHVDVLRCTLHLLWDKSKYANHTPTMYRSREKKRFHNIWLWWPQAQGHIAMIMGKGMH